MFAREKSQIFRKSISNGIVKLRRWKTEWRRCGAWVRRGESLKAVGIPINASQSGSHSVCTALLSLRRKANFSDESIRQLEVRLAAQIKACSMLSTRARGELDKRSAGY